MSQRPELSRTLDGTAFRSYYYLKQELADFCKENGLPASGGKAELTDMSRWIPQPAIITAEGERK